MTRPRISPSTAFCIRLSPATPERFMENPTPATISTASQKLSARAKARVVTPSIKRLAKVSRVIPLMDSRDNKTRQESTAPKPMAEVNQARPAAPRPKTPSANPGNRSGSARTVSAVTPRITRIGRMPGWRVA